MRHIEFLVRYLHKKLYRVNFRRPFHDHRTLSGCRTSRSSHNFSQERIIHTEGSRPFFITTPIFYVNAAPHIGHMYTACLADAISRWKKIKGEQVIFSTGTDEHGLKVKQAANAKNVSPQTFCNTLSQEFRDLFSAADIQYTHFLRTTDEKHKQAVQHFWTTLCERGYIYKGKYSGWYCTPDEAYLPEDFIEEIIDNQGNKVMVSKESGHPVEWMEEENYLFRLSEFQPQINSWIENGGVYPKYMKYVTDELLDKKLTDLSVSRERSRLDWGIQVPGDETQTIYVWLDALVNYLTIGGYPDPGYTWPADIHIVGKDILKFHAMFWPAFLLAAGLEPPKRVVCHSHWTVNYQKMSKSKGNVIDPIEFMAKYKTDGLRYFLLRNGVLEKDCNFDERLLIDVLNNDLANTIGNLLSRSTAKKANPSQIYPAFNKDFFEENAEERDKLMVQVLMTLPDVVDAHFEKFNFRRGMEEIINYLYLLNEYMQRTAIWKLSQTDDRESVQNVLHVTYESLRICGILLQPAIPTLANTILSKLGVSEDCREFRHIVMDCVTTDRPLNTELKGHVYKRIEI